MKSCCAHILKPLWGRIHTVLGQQHTCRHHHHERAQRAQVEVINDAFTPSAEEIAAAQEIVDLFAANPGVGTIGHKGAMLDRPHLARALLLPFRLVCQPLCRHLPYHLAGVAMRQCCPSCWRFTTCWTAG